jgi:hypothetical protein
MRALLRLQLLLLLRGEEIDALSKAQSRDIDRRRGGVGGGARFACNPRQFVLSIVALRTSKSRTAASGWRVVFGY